MGKSARKTYNLIDEVNALADHINRILNEKKERYFEGIALLHSFIEDLLKWLVLTQILWNNSEKEIVMPLGEFEALKNYCNQLSFYQLLNVGLCVGLLDYALFQRLDQIRVERNQLVHQYWLYVHKSKLHILRKKLEKLAGLGNTLVSKLNRLVEETGMDESYGFFDIKPGRNLIP